MSEKKTWSHLFAPSHTPMQMLDNGIMCDCHYIVACKDIPSKYKDHPKVFKRNEESDPTKNKFGVKSRQSLKEWQRKGWIKPQDPCGWIEWYIKYFEGRRIEDYDKWQIGRWRSFVARHQGQINADPKSKNKDARVVQKQALLQWGWNWEDKFTEQRH